MTMAFLRRVRSCFLGALFTLLLSGAARFAAVAHERGLRIPCLDCDGTGLMTTVSVSQGTSSAVLTTRGPCAGCAGSGTHWMVEDCFLRALPSFLRDVALIAIVTILGTTLCAFKVVDCRGCEGAGCDGCEGRGWVTAADRWAV
jgi:hypothetical protein